ncbi:hypothetical protein HBZS_113740 [Helicobacter bizzozeronii CCUG 35545]|nr:hypothetical protein HBZS_113740 [Helicobacter bizzozeronii CCUG 35545]
MQYYFCLAKPVFLMDLLSRHIVRHLKEIQKFSDHFASQML